MKIYLLRHSESQDDLLNCYGGASDWDLTDSGVKKVESFRPKFEKYSIDKIYVSPMRRAYKTADILNKNIKSPIEKVFDLHESFYYGFLTGIEKNLAKELFAYLLEKPEYQNAGYYNGRCLPGGEKAKQLDKRIKKVVKYILKDSKDMNGISIITHAGVLRSIFQVILKDNRKILDIKDVACVELEYRKGHFSILKSEGFVFEKN